MTHFFTMSPSSTWSTLIEWIRREIDDVARTSNSSTGSRVLSSDKYLLSALRVAYSLADCICEAEGNKDKDKLLPMPSSDWSDGVIVYDTPLHQTTNTNIEITEIRGQENLIQAGFLPSSFNMNNGDGINNDINPVQYIYSLGIVFYEIFSGGDRPVELGLGLGRTSAVGSEELSVQNLNFDPLPFDQVVVTPIDFGNNLDILDDLWRDGGDEDKHDGEHLPKKRQTHENNSNHTRSSISVEPLKAKWIPGSLCDLIANMFDSVDDTLSGEDSYKSMMDVRDDLRLMLEKPATFLYDQDVGRLSITGLRLRDTGFGRNAELSKIKDAYRRSLSGDGELVVISGVSGSGKSLLATEFGAFVSAGGGIVLSGKFDQLKQGKPFSALASAFDAYCGKLMRKDSSLSAEEIALKLISTLRREIYHLARIMPNLAIILGPRMIDLTHEQACANPQERLEYLLCQFVEVISKSFDSPVTLFLDDLQWADTASIGAVKQLLSSSLSSIGNRIFFLGCCREEEVDEKHPIWSVIDYAKVLDVKYTNLKLKCFEEKTLNLMVSETLCLSPRLTCSLSRVIYQKTKGNPLFVSRLMLSLNKGGLLRPNLNRRRWEWDIDKIQGQKLPDDVAMFITNSIEALSEEVQSSLCVLSCFGASVDKSLIKTLEKVLDRTLLDNIDTAAAEGMIDKIDDEYRFSHDRIQEAAYNMMDDLNRCNFHFAYGMALAALEDREEDGRILFTATNQLNLAGPEAVQAKSQYVIIADLNLRAGKKAMEMSDFIAAYSYFDNGISFLRKKHWEEHYALSLELFDLAAKCALTNGNVISLNILSQQVLEKSQSFEDKLNVMFYAMCALASSSKLQDSIERGLNILSKLGIDLRGCKSMGTEACLQETRDLLSGYTNDEILNTKRMTDPTMIIAMKFLGKLEIGMAQIMPKSAPHATHQIIQLSLAHGMSPVSPIGFVQYGSHIARFGDINGGYRYVKLAHSLLEKVSRENAGQVICFATHIVAYVEPLQAVLGYYQEGYAAAMAAGNIFLAGSIAMIGSTHSFFAGENLQSVRERFTEAIKFMVERNQTLLTVKAQCHQQSILKLMGINEKPKHVSEEYAILATNNSVTRLYYFQRMYMSFIFRSYDDAKDSIEKYLACTVDGGGTTLYLAHAFHAFYVGLVSFWLARKWSEEQCWHQTGKRSKLAFKQWTESSQWTFENKRYLLEAEESFYNNDFDGAKSYYEKAIVSAKTHKFVHEEALAYELAAHFYLELGETNKSLEYFLLARERYQQWGATGKCDSLSNFLVGVMRVCAGQTPTIAGHHEDVDFIPPSSPHQNGL